MVNALASRNPLPDTIKGGTLPPQMFQVFDLLSAPGANVVFQEPCYLQRVCSPKAASLNAEQVLRLLWCEGSSDGLRRPPFNAPSCLKLMRLPASCLMLASRPTLMI